MDFISSPWLNSCYLRSLALLLFDILDYYTSTKYEYCIIMYLLLLTQLQAYFLLS